MKYIVYFVSDHTGLTAESMGKTLLSQFKNVEIETHAVPFMNSAEKIAQLVIKLEVLASRPEIKVVVFSTIVNPQLRQQFSGNNLLHIDFFNQFMPRLEEIFQEKASGEIGRSHGVGNYTKYMTRIEAIDYSLLHDDGLNPKHYEKADIILVGVSRSGKTPTCLYMAIQFGIQAANYPITEEDLSEFGLPKILLPYKKKLFGLLIDPIRLHQIRTERLPNSRYASLEQCQYELKRVEQLFKQEEIPYLNTTSLSIEEISTQVLFQAGIEKRLY